MIQLFELAAVALCVAMATTETTAREPIQEQILQVSDFTVSVLITNRDGSVNEKVLEQQQLQSF